MSVARNSELQSLDLSLAHLDFPGEDESIEFGAVQQISKADHTLPFGLLFLTVFKPLLEDACYIGSFMGSELAFKRVSSLINRLCTSLLSVPDRRAKSIEALLELLESAGNLGRLIRLGIFSLGR